VLDVVDLLVAQGRSDLEHDVGFGKQVITRYERRTSLLVVFIPKLCMHPGIVFDEHLSKAFLAKEGDILRCEGDATFVWEYFSRDANSQGRERDSLKTGVAKTRFRENGELSGCQGTYRTLLVLMRMWRLNAHVWIQVNEKKRLER
jgi:hypothetical protein